MKKIIVIGAGIAGLSAGCYARMNGYDAHIYEMHDLPGGLCTAWKRKGYTFDGCLHSLIGTSPESPSHKIWRELGALKDKKIFYKEIAVKVHLKERVVTFFNDPEVLSGYLLEWAPEDKDMIRDLVDLLKRVSSFFNIPLSKPKELWTAADALKEMKNALPIIGLFRKYGDLTIDEYAGRFRNPTLRKAIRALVDTTQKNGHAVQSVMAIPVQLANKNCGFPEGGSLGLARSLERRFTDLGGVIHYRKKVLRILVENDAAVGIRCEDGETANAGAVVSAADGYSTIFTMLEGRYVGRKLARVYQREAVSPSFVLVSVGADIDLSADADHDSVLYLYDLERPIEIAGGKTTSLRLMNYSHDPAFAPKGKSALAIPFVSRMEYWEKHCPDKESYQSEKRKIQETVAACLEENVPGMKGKIEVIEVATPMTFHRYTNSWQGSSMGFSKGFLLNLPRTLPKLREFYMAGQWVGDMGVDGAARSGRDIVELICHRDKRPIDTVIP